MKLTKLFKEFFDSEKAGGLTLVICTVVSLLLANSNAGTSYISLWHIQFQGQSIEYWINEGIMSIFFLLIGLELEREIYLGELSNFKNALLPTFAAMGGMFVPAGIFLLVNTGTGTQSGAGIPMATDIAFALGVLSLVGNRIPLSLKIFLTALAVIDDIGAIIIIAIFYTNTLSWLNLLIVSGVFLLLLILNRCKVHHIFPYMAGGAVMWYFMLHSGIHATITGILLAFVIPFGKGDNKSTSYKLQHFLHKPVAFFILPLFALANTAIVLHPGIIHTLKQPYAVGIALGLIVGKPAGILLFTWMAVQSGVCKLPEDLNWKTVLGIGLLGGIGFTMSIFITLLAFDNEPIITNAKFAILLSSVFAGISGYLTLKHVVKKYPVQV